MDENTRFRAMITLAYDEHGKLHVLAPSVPPTIAVFLLQHAIHMVVNGSSPNVEPEPLVAPANTIEIIDINSARKKDRDVQ